MNYKKGFGTIESLLIVLIVLVLGFGIYFVTKNKVPDNSNYLIPTKQDFTPQTQNNTQTLGNTPQQQNNIISIANWKTYTNTACKYSFKYPDSWSQLGSESNAINLQGVVMSRMIDFIDTASQGIETSDGNNNQVYAQKDHMHIECYTMGSAIYGDELSRYNNSSDIFSQNKKTVTIDGQTAIVGEMTNTATVSSGEHAGRTIIPSHNIFVFLMHKDQTHALYFKFDTPIGNSDTVEIANFEQLLKTIKLN